MNKYLIADQTKIRHEVWICRCNKITKRPIHPSCNIAEVNEFDLYVENPISHLNRLFISELFVFCLVLALVRIPCSMKPVIFTGNFYTCNTLGFFPKYIPTTGFKEIPMYLHSTYN